MAYGDLYQGRRRAAPAPEPTPQPNGLSHVEFQRRLHPPALDASAGLNEAERRQVIEIKRLMADGSWGFGNIIPRRLLAAVFDGAPPQGMQLDLGASITQNASSENTASLAAKVEHDLRGSLATDAPHPRRVLSTDGPQQRPLMSYKLAQVMGDYELLDEGTFEDAMKRCGVTEPRDRIALKHEAMALGMMRQRGSALAAMQARQRQKRDVGDPPGRKSNLTLEACDARGYAAYDGTGIELL